MKLNVIALVVIDTILTSILLENSNDRSTVQYKSSLSSNNSVEKNISEGFVKNLMNYVCDEKYRNIRETKNDLLKQIFEIESLKYLNEYKIGLEEVKRDIENDINHNYKFTYSYLNYLVNNYYSVNVKYADYNLIINICKNISFYNSAIETDVDYKLFLDRTKKFKNIIRITPNITDLNINLTRIFPNYAFDLISAAGEKLQKLKICSKQSDQDLCEILENCKYLNKKYGFELFIEDSEIKEENVPRFSAALSKLNIMRLSLDKIKIIPSNILQKSNSYFQFKNFMNKKSVKLLNVKEITGLTKLHIKETALSRKDVKEIIKILNRKENPLQILQLSCLNFNNKHYYIKLLKNVQKSQTLKAFEFIDMNNNGISNKIGYRLSNILKKSTSLRNITIEIAHCQRNFFIRVQNALKYNKTLNTLEIMCSSATIMDYCSYILEPIRKNKDSEIKTVVFKNLLDILYKYGPKNDIIEFDNSSKKIRAKNTGFKCEPKIPKKYISN